MPTEIRSGRLAHRTPPCRRTHPWYSTMLRGVGSSSALTRDMAPSAYFDRAAVVLASNYDDAASVIYALRALKIGKVYTVGFNAAAIARSLPIEPSQQPRTCGEEPTTERRRPSSSSARWARTRATWWACWSTLWLKRRGRGHRKVFLDLADGSAPRRGDPSLIAEQSGFAAYGVADVTAFTTVETLRLLVGQNVPYRFVRLATGSGLY